jgi:hypothetical protein
MRDKYLNKILLIPFFLLLLSVFLILGFHGYKLTSANEQYKVGVYKIELPPKSLDKLYPPQAKEPVWLLEMLKLAVFFTSTSHDALQGDWENAQGNFATFKEQIIKLSGMIPEWKDHFKMDLVEELGRAVEEKNVPAIMEVRGKKIGPNMCVHCHSEHTVSVWYRYHWKDFGKIMVDDPISQKKFPFYDFMFGVAESFEGIALDMQQGQPDNAQKTFKAFTTRVEALKKACNECHDPKKGEKKYFTGPDVMEKMADLGAEVSKSGSAPERVEHLIMEIGKEMCYECHQVHWPAGNVQRVWNAQMTRRSHQH